MHRAHGSRGIALALPFALLACGDSARESDSPAPLDGSRPYKPRVTSDELSPEITNPYFPAPVGATWVFEATTGEGVERIEVEVEAATRDVWGASARVVRDTEFLDGEMIEDTWDWFAQDEAGHVWYLGEDTAEYEDGEVVSREGAWESGVNGALPGVIMLADPQVGDEYRQEFFEGEAEDYGEVISLDESVAVPAGSWTDCLQTRDRSVLDPELDELKYYCRGVGTVLIEEGDIRVELVEYGGL